MTAIDEQWDWLLARADLPRGTREMVAAAHQRIQLARLFLETITGNRRVSITHSRMISTAPAGLLAKRAG